MTDYLSLLENPIAFHRVYARIGNGAAAGVFISQLVYWHSTMEKAKGEAWDGWFYKTAADWEEETCTTRRERENAEKVLVKAKILSIARKGVPAKKHYKLNKNALNDAVSKFVISDKQDAEPSDDASLPDVANKNDISDKQDCQNEQTSSPDVASKSVSSDKQDCQNEQSITENKQRLPDINSDTKTDNSSASVPDDGNEAGADPWVSEKGKVLKPSQQKIFSQLWDAFQFKRERAPAIDQFLKIIWPQFGRNAEANRQLLSRLLSAIAATVAERDPSITPQYFERWIKKRRWEDEHQPATQSTGQSANDQGEAPEWQSLGFESAHQKIEFDNEYRSLKALQDKPELTSNDLALIDAHKRALKRLAPKREGEAA